MSWFILGLIEAETLDMYSPLIIQKTWGGGEFRWGARGPGGVFTGAEMRVPLRRVAVVGKRPENAPFYRIYAFM